MDEPGHGIREEPHLRGDREHRLDPSERLAERILAAEARFDDPSGHEASQSVYDEVHPLHTMTGKTEGGWAEWYRSLRQAVTPLESWATMLLVALCSGPLAIVGAFLSHQDGPFSTIVFVPAAEELLKVGLLAILLETRPYLVRSAWQLRLVAVSSALGFATVENLLYLHVYLSNPSEGLVLWRWTVCTGMHVLATSVAAEGLVRSWRRTERTGRRPSLDHAYRWLVLAVLVHGSYNLVATLLELAHFEF